MLSGGVALVPLGIGTLALGMAIYHWVERLAWPDAFLNAAMLLGGMGPVDPLHTTSGQVVSRVLRAAGRCRVSGAGGRDVGARRSSRASSIPSRSGQGKSHDSQLNKSRRRVQNRTAAWQRLRLRSRHVSTEWRSRSISQGPKAKAPSSSAYSSAGGETAETERRSRRPRARRPAACPTKASPLRIGDLSIRFANAATRAYSRRRTTFLSTAAHRRT